MARNNQYPIILGMTPPNKQGIGIKSKLGSGYDLYILDEDMTHQYAQLHFCNKEAVDRMIELLQRMKELWEREGLIDTIVECKFIKRKINGSKNIRLIDTIVECK